MVRFFYWCVLFLALTPVGFSQAETYEASEHSVWSAFKPEFQREVCPFGAGVSYDDDEFICGYVLVP
ncbi:MAG: hypothetical protein AAFQ67_00005 [Pseudomonadota bacterium]